MAGLAKSETCNTGGTLKTQCSSVCKSVFVAVLFVFCSATPNNNILFSMMKGVTLRKKKKKKKKKKEEEEEEKKKKKKKEEK